MLLTCSFYGQRAVVIARLHTFPAERPQKVSRSYLPSKSVPKTRFAVNVGGGSALTDRKYSDQRAMLMPVSL